MIDAPDIIRTAAQRTAVIRIKVPRAQIRQVMGPAMREVRDVVIAQGIGPSGPLYSHHFAVHADVFDFEVGVPVSAPVSPAGRVQPGEIPAAEMARTVYHGPYEGLGNAWVQFDDWIAANSHIPAPDLWERYLSGPDAQAEPASMETELSRAIVDWESK